MFKYPIQNPTVNLDFLQSIVHDRKKFSDRLRRVMRSGHFIAHQGIAKVYPRCDIDYHLRSPPKIAPACSPAVSIHFACKSRI